MNYSKAVIKDGKLVMTESKEIAQESLTSDCWLVQFDGLKACEHCEVKGTFECGGGETLQRIKRGA